MLFATRSKAPWFSEAILRNVFRERAGRHQQLRTPARELESHLGVSRYGSFTLTEAVRPSYDLQVVPCQGYRHDSYRDEQSHNNVPVLMAAVSHEHLFETFMELLDPLGFTVDVVLETSHNRHNKGHSDLYREHIDLPVLKSVLWEYEEMQLNDGCTGMAVLNPDILRGSVRRAQADRLRRPVAEYENILRQRSVGCDEQVRDTGQTRPFSSDVCRQFDELRTRLGMIVTQGTGT